MKKDTACFFVLLAILLLVFAQVSAVLAWNGSWQTDADAGFQFTRFDAEYYPGDGKVYFMGGRLSDSSTDGSVWSYDPKTGVYADTGVDLVTPISNYTMNLIQDANGWGFYVFCGRMANGVHTHAVQVYYPDTNTAVQLNGADDFPGMTCSAAMNVVYDNKVYLAGGYDGVNNGGESAVYDPMAPVGARWTSVGFSFTPPRGYIMGAVVNDLIYAIGGAWWDGVNSNNVSTVQVLDPNAPLPTWNPVADLPEACSSSRAFGFDDASPYRDPHGLPLAGRIISGCGFWSDENERVYAYSVENNTWKPFPSLQIDRRDQAGAFIPPGAAPKGAMSGMCMWGGRKDSDAGVLLTPEYYEVYRFPWAMFLPGITSQDSP